jgi:hypothetical protein
MHLQLPLRFSKYLSPINYKTNDKYFVTNEVLLIFVRRKTHKQWYRLDTECVTSVYYVQLVDSNFATYCAFLFLNKISSVVTLLTEKNSTRLKL